MTGRRAGSACALVICINAEPRGVEGDGEESGTRVLSCCGKAGSVTQICYKMYVGDGQQFRY